MSWLMHTSTTLPNWALLCLLAAAALALASLFWQTRQCRRWHVDIGDDGYDDDNYAEWDDEPPAPAMAGEAGHEHERTAN